MDRHRLTKTIAAALKGQPVSLAYLFGSQARGTADEESDVDVAVLAEEGLLPQDRHGLRVDLSLALADRLQLPLERIDVVVLQDVPILLQYNVIRCGSLILSRNPSVAKAYILSVEQEYEHESPYLDRDVSVTINRILARRA